MFKNLFKMPKPNLIVGPPDKPYLKRWYLIPRNKFFNIYLHQFVNDDEDRALHDHPWHSISFTLKGFYFEHLPDGDFRIWKAGSIVFRKATHLHRIALFYDLAINDAQKFVETRKPAWTLFITGPNIREWGFACPQGWVHWKDFVLPDDQGRVGKGCDQ